MKLRIKPSDLWPLILLLAVFFGLRFQHWQSLPVFGDEAIYLRWSQLIKNVDTLRFVPLSDGKQPLFMWITAVFLKFIRDPLLAGRSLSVFAGALSLAGLYVTGLLFFNRRTAILAALIYLLLPFAFFFDRIGLPDNLLTALGVLSLLFSILLARFPRLDLAMILGFFLGFAWLTKSPAVYFIALSFLTFLILNFRRPSMSFLPLISVFISFIIYNILRLGPQFSQIALRNRDYVWGFSDILRHPLDPFVPHLHDIMAIYSVYLSWPLLLILFTVLGFLLFKRKISALLIILLAWWLLPLLANAAIAKVFTARYFLYTVPPLILILAYSLDYISNFLKNSRFPPGSFNWLVVLIFIPNLLTIYHLSADPFNFQPTSTETGYFSDWTSGWGIREASGYLISRSREANVIVGTEGYFGTLPDGLQIYVDRVPQLTVFGVGIDLVKLPEKLLDARSHGDEVYLLFNQSRLKLTPDDYRQLTLVKSYVKPGRDRLLLLRLN